VFDNEIENSIKKLGNIGYRMADPPMYRYRPSKSHIGRSLVFAKATYSYA